MASAAEQMAANLSWGAFGKASDLRARILFTVGILIVYRLGTYIPVPGIDAEALRSFMDKAGQGIGGMLNMFTGGAISRMGVFALGIMPYISASIIVQLMTSMLPGLEQLKKEGEQGRKKINQYTRYGTVGLATLQSYGLAASLSAGNLVNDPGLFFTVSCMITLIGGTMFLMWLGEQITARGIGNGISLIIFVGIVAHIPEAIAQFLSQGRSGALSPFVIISVILMVVAVIAFCVFMERALRKIHIQYPRRQVGMKVYDGSSSHLPIKVNPAGVIPAIFASSLLLLPATLVDLLGQFDEPDPVRHPCLSRAGTAAAPDPLRGDDHFLRLFLHRQRRLQIRGCGREPEEPGRLHSRHPSRRQDGRLPRLCCRAHPDPGVRLSDACLPAARGSAVAVRHSRSTSAARRC